MSVLVMVQAWSAGIVVGTFIALLRAALERG